MRMSPVKIFREKHKKAFCGRITKLGVFGRVPFSVVFAQADVSSGDRLLPANEFACTKNIKKGHVGLFATN